MDPLWLYYWAPSNVQFKCPLMNHKMHKAGYQMSTKFLRSPASSGHLRWGNALSYKLEEGNSAPLRSLHFNRCVKYLHTLKSSKL